MSKRTPTDELRVFKMRVEQLLAKEARCPLCLKVRAGLDPMAPQVPCYQHFRIRQEMAFPSSFRRLR